MKKRLFLSIIIAFIVTFGWILVSESTLTDISDDIVRLHIVANSDSKSDQQIKLKVRDRLLSENFENIKFDLKRIEAVCKNEISENGYAYKVKAEFGMFYFPNKSYENITLPAGNYNALRVTIGEGDGENWWCVMYPPLCYSGSINGKLSEEDITLLKENMKKDNFDMLENNEIKIKPTLKIVEWWQKIRHGI